MSATIDEKAIIAKAMNYTKTANGKKRVQDVVASEAIKNAMSAGVKLKSILEQSIRSSGLPSGVADALDCVTVGTPTISGNLVHISVSFSDDMSRRSLQPDRYDDIKSLAALYNDGVDHKMNPVYGEWHGKWTRSKTTIPSTNFMEAAAHDFMSAYASTYNVVNIKINK